MRAQLGAPFNKLVSSCHADRFGNFVSALRNCQGDDPLKKKTDVVDGNSKLKEKKANGLGHRIRVIVVEIYRTIGSPESRS